MGDEAAPAALVASEPKVLSEDETAAISKALEESYEGKSFEELLYYSKQERDADEETKDNEELAFAELSLENLQDVLNACRKTEDGPGPLYEGAVFVDLGSGAGKQVVAASMLHNFKKCAGIECVGALDERAQAALAKFKESHGDLIKSDNSEVLCSKADCFEGVGEHIGEDQMVILCVASAFKEETMQTLATAVKNAPVGSFCVTFTRALPAEDPCWEVADIQKLTCPWGDSTVFIQKKTAMPANEEEA